MKGDANYKRVYYKCLLLFIVRSVRRIAADVHCAVLVFLGGEVNAKHNVARCSLCVQHHLIQ